VTSAKLPQPSHAATPPRAPKPTSAYRLARGALSDFRAGWIGYSWILAIIAIPVNFFALSQSQSNVTDTSSTVYGYAAILVMNAGLLWAVVEQGRTRKVPRPGSAYYDGSALIIRVVVITILLSLMALPLLFALTIYASAARSIGASGAELLLIGLVLSIVALPTFILVTRFGLGIIVSAVTGLRPIAALRVARQLTLGRFWLVFGRFAGLILFMIIIAVPMALLVVLLSFLNLEPLAIFLFGVITTLTALPLFDLYLLRLYRSLELEPAE
jgi:hypothetical protein